MLRCTKWGDVVNSAADTTSTRHALGESPGSTPDPLMSAQSWVLRSGIRIADPADANYGAVYAYYDCRRRRHELVYAEATGYILSLLKYLSSIGGTGDLLEIAKASGDWLVRFADRYDGLLAKGLVNGQVSDEVYAFDNGVCCKGLLDLYALTGEPRYLHLAERLAGWLAGEALNADGSVKPLLDLRSGQFVENAAVWYKASGSFHAKIAMPLLHLHRLQGKQNFLDAALRLCRWTVQQQKPDGSFPANRGMETTNLHAHCYTIEALLYAYASLHEAAFLDAAKRAAAWMVRGQGPDGRHWLWHGGGSPRMLASYAQAQVVRILALLSRGHGEERDAQAARMAATFLVRMQASEGDSNTIGGFVEPAVRKYGLIVRRGPQSTSWAAMFAIHALSLLDRRGRDFEGEVEYLF